MARRITNLLLGAWAAIVLLAGPAAAGAADQVSGAAAEGAYGLVVRESGKTRSRVFELEPSGEWRRVQRVAVCPETWERRCWREDRQTGVMTAIETADWVAKAKQALQQKASLAAPGAATVSIVVRRGSSVVAQGQLDAAASAAGPLFKLLERKQ